jgi:hypothetical protein
MMDCFETYIQSHFGPDRLEWLKWLTASLFFTLIPLHEDIDKNKKYLLLVKQLLSSCVVTQKYRFIPLNT